MDKTIIVSPSGHQIPVPVTQEYRIAILEAKVIELEAKLYDLAYQLCVHVTTEG